MDGTRDGQRGSVARGLINPLAWCAADKCLFVVAIMLPGVALFALVGHLVPGWVYLPEEMLGRAEGLVDRLTLLAGTIWTLMLLAGLFFRRRAPESRVYVVLTVLLYSLTIALFVCISGGYHSAGWILFLGGSVVGFLLFGRRLTFLGIGLFVVVFAAATLANEAGYLGDLLYVAHPPAPGSAAWSTWLVRMTVSTLVFGGMVLALCAWVIALLRDREAKLEHLSKTDVLTGLVNRRHLMVLIDSELARARRYGTPLAVVMVDLDHFKEVNDGRGHLAGDRVLAAVAEAMRESVRETDLAARYGGEEFVLLLPNTDRPGARELAERCREVIADTLVADAGGPIHVTASMGVAGYPADVDEGADVDALLAAADDAMYRAKGTGRNRVEMAAAADGAA